MVRGFPRTGLIPKEVHRYIDCQIPHSTFLLPPRPQTLLGGHDGEHHDANKRNIHPTDNADNKEDESDLGGWGGTVLHVVNLVLSQRDRGNVVSHYEKETGQEGPPIVQAAEPCRFDSKRKQESTSVSRIPRTGSRGIACKAQHQAIASSLSPTEIESG